MNVIIVDDEITTRSGLKELDMWKRLGVNQVLTASNGQMAVELMQTVAPSILITDIKMPKMDGIELSKYVQKYYPDCGIIFLSGFSDKEYLVHAIQVKAVEYLEKPVDFIKLEAVCTEILKQLSQKQILELERIQHQMMFENMRPLLRQQLLFKLVYHECTKDIFLEEETKKVFTAHVHEEYQIIAVQLHWNPKLAEDEIGRIRNEFLRSMNVNIYEDILLGFVVPTLFVVLIQNKENGEADYLKWCSEQIQICMKEKMKDTASYQVAQSARQKSWNQLPKIYEKTMELLNHRFYLRKGEKLLENKVIHQIYVLPPNFYKEYKELLHTGSTEELCKKVEDLTESILKIYDGDVLKIKNIYFNLIRILFEKTMQWSSTEQTDVADDSAYIWKVVNDQVSLVEIGEFLIENIKTLTNRNSESGSHVKMKKARHYIEENFADSQLSIQSIAEHVQLRETYLCVIFKREMETTVNQYIQRLRIEKACKLLENPRNRFYEIALAVGYSDTNYFSTLFKRITGRTLSAYREEKLHK